MIGDYHCIITEKKQFELWKYMVLSYPDVTHRQLKELVLRTGKSVNSIADESGISKMTMYNWITGKTKPRIHQSFLLQKWFKKNEHLVDDDIEIPESYYSSFYDGYLRK